MRVSRRGTIAVIVAVLVGVVGWMWRSAAGVRDASVAAPPALAVNLVEPVQETWAEIVSANGTVAAWQEAIISAETGSLRITELLVDVGSVVKRGQLLAHLSDDSAAANVRKQEAAVAEARANLKQAEADVRRAQVVADSGALSSQKIEQYAIVEATSRAALAAAEAELRSAQITLQQTRIVAVDDGIISVRSAVLGNVVSAGSELFRMVRQGRIEWQAELDAQQLARVQIGQHAHVTLPGSQVVDGEVRLLAPTLSTSTGRAIVYVSLAAGRGAQAGMFASGTIEVAQTRALTLPESAIVLRDGRSDVYVLNEDGATVSRRIVATGRRKEDRVEVVSGLAPGARVVASGGAFLAEGASVKIVAAESSGGSTP